MNVEDERLTFRDKIACKMCNFILRNIASTHYKNMIGGLIKMGISSVIDKDQKHHDKI
jgi:formate/nitrite transporter FocA (FNT family)